MNKYEKLVQAKFLNDEDVVISRLNRIYRKSFRDITEKIAELDSSIGQLQAAYNSVDANDIGDLAVAVLGKKVGNMTPAEAKATLASMLQSKIYQKDYQTALQKQVDSVLDKMHVEQYSTISDYLKQCYETGFVGTMYDLHGQGIPLMFPMDQEAMVMAVQLDSKINKGLYSHLGEDVTRLKKRITTNITRGISSGMTYEQIAQQISASMMGAYTNPGGSLAYAMRIARTEGHRIQVQSAMNACYNAKDMGADVVKQWDSTLDGDTRPSHRMVDGEIRELDEPFSNGLMFPGDPAGGAGEVVNCRCALLQRARWALDDDELETLKERAEFFGLDKSDNFDEFQKKYLQATAATPAAAPKKTYLTKKKLEQMVADLDNQIKNETDPKKLKNLEDLKADYQEKIAVKEAAQAKKKLISQEKAVSKQIDDFESNLKSYSFPGNSGKWSNVSAKDYANLKTDITKKKKYFEKQFLLSTDVDEMQKYQDYITQLKALESDGIKLAELKKELQKIKSQISTVGKKTKTTTIGNDIISNAKTFDSTSDAVQYHTQNNFSGDMWKNIFTSEDRDGIKKYTGSSYRPMNKDLRTGNYINSSVKYHIDNCTSALSKTSVADDVLVYRGMGTQSSVARMLGVDEVHLKIDTVRDSLIGTRFTEKGFLSTAIVPDSAWRGCKLDIYIPKGAQAMYVDPVSTHSGELELLIQRNSTFEVKEIVTDSAGIVTKIVVVLIEQTL